MIVSINWLKQFVDITEKPDELAELLSKTGLEAEVVGVPNELSGVIIAHVDTAEKHPDADKLKLCTVNDGKKIHQVVCGAPNVAAGQTIPFAMIGAILPGNFKIKKVKIRGVESSGMICSERELNISDEHEGIMVLPDFLHIGDDFMKSYGYKFLSLELDITPNRSDAFSHQGVARDISAATERKFSPLTISNIESKKNSSLNISMEDSWIVGDSTGDMLAAKQAGLKGILVKTGYAGKDGKYVCKPDFVANNLGSAVDLVMKVLEK